MCVRVPHEAVAMQSDAESMWQWPLRVQADDRARAVRVARIGAAPGPEGAELLCTEAKHSYTAGDLQSAPVAPRGVRAGTTRVQRGESGVRSHASTLLWPPCGAPLLNIGRRYQVPWLGNLT
jgi:hypothetical protein